MRPVRIITAVAFAAAVAVTGCAAHSTAADKRDKKPAAETTSSASPSDKTTKPKAAEKSA